MPLEYYPVTFAIITWTGEIAVDRVGRNSATRLRQVSFGSRVPICGECSNMSTVKSNSR